MIKIKHFREWVKTPIITNDELLGLVYRWGFETSTHILAIFENKKPPEFFLVVNGDRLPITLGIDGEDDLDVIIRTLGIRKP